MIMPDLSGMEFVKLLKNPPGIIFTTAYSEYAIEGYKVDAIDYLLKTIGYSAFQGSAEKARERLQPPQPAPNNKVEANEEFLFIKSKYKIVRIKLAETKYIEGMCEYVRIHLENEKPIMAQLSIKKMEEYLPSKSFMRVHRS